MLSANPKVSACVVAYNHGPYIRDCLQSLVDQQTSFDFEIIIGDDCSTDDTASIISEFTDNYPDLIRARFHQENLGAKGNYFSVHNEARGDYIIHLDGDDYALPGKFQAQFDYMEMHPEVSICWHRMKVINEHEVIVDDLIDLDKLPFSVFDKRDLTKYNSVACHSAKMYRKTCPPIPDLDFTYLDFFVNILQLGENKAAIIGNNFYGVYRRGTGMTTGMNKLYPVIAQNLEYLAENDPELRESVAFSSLFHALLSLKNFRTVGFVYLKVFLKQRTFISPLAIIRSWAVFKYLRAPS